MAEVAAARDARGVYLLRAAKPKDLEHVREFLRSHQIRLRAEKDGTVRVSVPGARTPSHERRELAGCITTWNALNPASLIELAEPDK